MFVTLTERNVAVFFLSIITIFRFRLCDLAGKHILYSEPVLYVQRSRYLRLICPRTYIHVDLIGQVYICICYVHTLQLTTIIDCGTRLIVCSVCYNNLLWLHCFDSFYIRSSQMQMKNKK